jgi:hypothetical protein
VGGRPIGRTPDSDSGYPGSSPGLPANLFVKRREETDLVPDFGFDKSVFLPYKHIGE